MRAAGLKSNQAIVPKLVEELAAREEDRSLLRLRPLPDRLAEGGLV